MEQIKIGGIAETGYMGGTKWTGVNSGDGFMRYSTINRLVRKEFNKKYPTTKVSCTGKSYSGGQSCNGIIMMKLNEIMVSYDEFEKSGYFPPYNCWYEVNGECVFGEEPKLTYEIRMKATYENFKKCLNSYSGISINTSRLKEGLEKYILKPDAIEKIEYLIDLYDSFNRYDVNGMVDYFDVNFYKDVSIKLIN